LRRQADSCQFASEDSEMYPTPDANQLPVVDPHDAAADETIALCGGDPRQAVEALLVTNEFLEHELELAKSSVSIRYVRIGFETRTK
jgi:hypothetical protein